MSRKLLKRRHLRAPLSSEVLYVDDEYTFKASTENISEGGILLAQLPHVPEDLSIPMMVALPQIPALDAMSSKELQDLRFLKLPKKIFRLKAKIVRKMEGMSSVEKVFLRSIGCEFIDLPETHLTFIHEYIQSFSKNCIYILNLFQSGVANEKEAGKIQKLASLLGYDGTEKISDLRHKIIHDYHSLDEYTM